MSENKRLWLVVSCKVDSDSYVSLNQQHYESEDDARTALAVFRQNSDAKFSGCDSTSLHSYTEQVSGDWTAVNPEWNRLNTLEQLAENPDVEKLIKKGVYKAEMQCVDIDPDDLQDSEREYTVELYVTRTYSFSVEVEAESTDAAGELAKDNFENDEYDHHMDYPDDQDIDIQDCYES